jgi:hypothetical protein
MPMGSVENASAGAGGAGRGVAAPAVASFWLSVEATENIVAHFGHATDFPAASSGTRS